MNKEKVLSKGLMLSEAIEQMKDAIRRGDLSDSYLQEVRYDNWTRSDCFCGEFCSGISMVPCTFALQLAEKVLKAEGDQFIYYDTDKGDEE